MWLTCLKSKDILSDPPNLDLIRQVGIGGTYLTRLENLENVAEQSFSNPTYPGDGTMINGMPVVAFNLINEHHSN